MIVAFLISSLKCHWRNLFAQFGSPIKQFRMERLRWNINFRDWSFGGAVHVLGNCQNIFDEHKLEPNNAFQRYFTVQ